MAAVAREEAARAARAAGGRNRASDVLSGKNSKRFLSVGVKKVILEELSAGRSQHELAIEYNVGLRTLRRIKKNRAQIEAAVNDASTRTANKHLSRPVLEKALVNWVCRVRSKKINLSVTRSALRVAAKKLAAMLLVERPPELEASEISHLRNWKPSESWVRRFVTRNSMSSVILHGTAGEVDLTDPKLVGEIEKIKVECSKYDIENDTVVDLLGHPTDVVSSSESESDEEAAAAAQRRHQHAEALSAWNELSTNRPKYNRKARLLCLKLLIPALGGFEFVRDLPDPVRQAADNLKRELLKVRNTKRKQSSLESFIKKRDRCAEILAALSGGDSEASAEQEVVAIDASLDDTHE